MDIIILETDRPIEDLANAIIVRAAKDYKRAVRKLRKDPEDINSLIRIVEIEDFFRSDWFMILTDLAGETLLNRLKQSLKE